MVSVYIKDYINNFNIPIIRHKPLSEKTDERLINGYSLHIVKGADCVFKAIVPRFDWFWKYYPV